MKLMRIGARGAERPIVRVDDATYVDVSDLTPDFDEAFFGGAGIAGLEAEVSARVAAGRVERFAGDRIGAPIARPHQIIGIGMNFAEHAPELGLPVPPEPLIFSKSPNALSGPDDDVVIPRASRKTDYEVELGVVIGRRSMYLQSDDEAAAAIAGYVLANDVSEREFQQERSGQFMKGKSAPTFCPVGPWLATPDEFADIRSLQMTSTVNGEVRQNGSTATMIFGPLFLVRYLSQFLTLEPGDLVLTGTPPGVGLGFTPPRFLAAGDVVELAIDGLGTQRQTLAAAG
ncbi:fumarylacetoacetate hydrolase family protein [Pseudolysinimonas yzui]|uniref:Ureidoglycolate lyase n=1 Tax=Pseudolysinimonas yzui TaxID=2708254 RepID=A0A8J3GR53_9MICO|nr:fumarylacetoacetate hydrolase family protein [Pseudolysinimonas yzui]GHF18012.1 ureidoglycolate lyase [Pseudolysinimonas yzui]